MPTNNLDTLTRRYKRHGGELVIVRPVVALTMYSVAPLAAVMSATADALESYLGYVAPGALASQFDDSEEEAEMLAFDADAQRELLDRLRAGPEPDDDENQGVSLFGTGDGQAGNHGFHFAGIEVEQLKEGDKDASMLRLELPWDLPAQEGPDAVAAFIAQVAGMFPFCCGNAGLSFSYAAVATEEAIETLQKLLPRYAGFDSMFGAAYLKMRDKSPPAHWINLLDGRLIAALGGEKTLHPALAGCELRGIGKGLMIRAARVPPVVDVNWHGTDIGRLPDVARAILPVRLDAGMFTPMGNEERGLAWLARFDALTSGDWNNG